MKALLIELMLLLQLSPTQATPASSSEDGVLYGACYGPSGQPCAENFRRISTSWNSLKAYPDDDGNYELRFGAPVDARLTIYCDGNRVGDVYVDGRTRFDVRCK